MFDIELLRGYYKGAEVKIALIDTGVEKDKDNETYNIKNFFYNYNTNRIEKSINKPVHSKHGSLCSKYILDIAPQITLLDINVENDFLEITEDSVCEAIDFAIENKCDLINISLGFSMYSEKLYLSCKKAYDNNIIITAAAAHNNDLVFPADNDYTVKIIYEDNDEEKITKINNKSYKINLKPIYDYEYDVESKSIRISASMGSSIACAYFTAILALYLESRPLNNRKKLIDTIIENHDNVDIYINQNSLSEITINNKSVFSAISSYYDCIRYKNIMNKNILGFYDLLQKETIYFNNDKDSYYDDNLDLYLINPLHHQRTQINNINFKNINYVGDFKNTNCYRGKSLDRNDTLREIETPVILIAGVGTDCGKFNVQLELKKQMTENKLPNYCITYNPLGYIFDMDFLEYPENASFQNLIYSLNGYLKNIENESDYESIIIDVAGGMFPLSRINTNNFGMLYHAYLNAISVDYIIICTNSIINITVIEHEIKKLNLLGHTDIAIVVSNLSYNIMGLENSFGNIPYIEEDEKIKNCVTEYKNYFSDIPVFNLNKISDGLLYKKIIDTMSN